MKNAKGNVIPALLGAIGGGVLVMVATRAIPAMLSNFMSGMMHKMMAQAGGCGCNPKEMCGKVMALFAEEEKASPAPGG